MLTESEIVDIVESARDKYRVSDPTCQADILMHDVASDVAKEILAEIDKKTDAAIEQMFAEVKNEDS